jgi:hypothetical protein
MLVFTPPRKRIFIAIGVIMLLFYLIPPLLIPAGLGLIMALPAFIHPLHRLGEKFPTVRLSLAFVLGLTSFTIFYGSVTYDMAHHSFTAGEYRYECQSCDNMIYFPFEHTEEESDNQQAIIMEYWARELLLPTYQTSCNTGSPLACRLADEIFSRRGWGKLPSWSDFLITFLVCHLATIWTIFFVVIFAHNRHGDIPLSWSRFSRRMD